MNIKNQKLQTLNIVLGVLSIAIFGYALYVFLRLQPKMVAFETLSDIESGMITGVGFGLLFILAFYLFSLLQMVIYLKHSESVKPIPLVLIICGVISMLFVFSDVALLNDIAKQYRYGLSQPEWSLVYSIMGFQFVITLILMCLHVSGFFVPKQVDKVARDINIFLIVQYVGVICGLMGLASSSLGFLFPHAWSLPLHTIMGGSILLFPYVLSLVYWVLTKFKEKDRQWWDEKQLQDIGKSA
ncbi:MAG: hypothetical protein U9R53_11630 [Chloroflexota bacterium]|nr:hypothetical protein [Chloroflexota bacterium]